jgi:hypothetical protein
MIVIKMIYIIFQGLTLPNGVVVQPQKNRLPGKMNFGLMYVALSRPHIIEDVLLTRPIRMDHFNHVGDRDDRRLVNSEYARLRQL